jgi:hypothetical protein
MECKPSYAQGTMFGKSTDANPIELRLAPSQGRGGFYRVRGGVKIDHGTARKRRFVAD